MLDTDGESGRMTGVRNKEIVTRDVSTEHRQESKGEDIPLLEVGRDCAYGERAAPEGNSSSWRPHEIQPGGLAGTGGTHGEPRDSREAGAQGEGRRKKG